MKKFLALLLALVMSLSLVACGGGDDTAADGGADAEDGGNAETAAYQVAMITDYGDITDQSFNQTTYEACQEFCDAEGLQFEYYKPAGDSTAERVAMVDAAVADGYNVIVMPGYAFAETIKETAELYPDVTFIALDVAQGDLGEDYTVPSNVYCAVYQEELCGYMFGYGFVQGADAAAVEMGIADQVVMEYAYGNQFYGDSDITAYMDNWYQTLGVEVVFASGGGIYTSAAEAAAKVGGKLIGVDVDQSANIDTYGEGMCVTSAMKGLAETVKHMLGEVVAGNFANYGGQVETLGLVNGDDPTANYVQLPMETTQWGDGFTQDDYKALVKAMYDGDVTVSNDISAMPATTITVNFAGNIK